MISIIFPCLNEEKAVGICIEKTLEIIKQNNLDAEIIVVDNNSNDSSKSIIQSFPVRYIFEKNRGYGNAYKTGIKYAKGDKVIMVDCDCSYDLNEIPKFIKELENSNFVIGNRFNKLEKNSMSNLRKLGNPLIRLLLRLHGLKITETSTGFIGINKSLLQNLNLKSEGMEFSSELLIKAHKKTEIKEIPITYHPRIGKSKLNEFSDGLRHLKLLTLTRTQ